MRRPLRVFRELTSVDGRLGFYTQETRELIPEQPGCYAWFLPLWIYENDLNELMKIVGEVYGYEQDPERTPSVEFTWTSVDLRVGLHSRVRPIAEDLNTTWSRIIADDEAKEALEQLLLESSLLMPPLYVGRTGNLKGRYQQHVAGTRGRNDFHARFSDCIAKSDFSLTMSDLLFVCVSTHDELTKRLDEFPGVERLIEQILMQFCRPPFSLR